MTPLLANAEALERDLRSDLTSLHSSVERIEQSVRRMERANDPRAFARLTRTLGVIVATLGLDDELAAVGETDTAAAGSSVAVPPSAPRDDNTLHLIGRDDTAAG
jgi:hypothetical protein